MSWLSPKAPRSVLGTLLVVACASGAVACADECRSDEVQGPGLLFGDPDRFDTPFFAHPWPSDARRDQGGALSLATFPNPTRSSAIEDYIEMFEGQILGFGTSAAAYLAFSESLSRDSLPEGPLEATAADASLALVDIDPSSPRRGERFPLEIQYRDEATQFLPRHHLIARTPYGVPLAGNTTYALIGTSALKTRRGETLRTPSGLHNALRSGCAEDASRSIFRSFSPLRAYLEELGGDLEEIVVATVFTTQDAVGEIRELHAAALAEPVPEVGAYQLLDEGRYANKVGAEVLLPSFQEGRVPFERPSDGGAIARGEDGAPVVVRRETTRVGISIPRGNMPPSGWPVVLYAHGTGGSFESVFNETVADALARAGIAAVGYDLTLHGPRDPTGSDPRLTYFNLANPLAARENLRQGVVDATIMTSLLFSGWTLPEEVAGSAARFDAERIGFIGHSQGALVGAYFAAADERPKAIVFSGLGAILVLTLLERKDIVDLAAVMRLLLRLDEAEVLDEWHPAMSLFQTLIEPADPIAYASSYLFDPPGNALRDMLMVEGFLDLASPARGQEAFAFAAGFPVISPVHRVPAAGELLGPLTDEAPAFGNVETVAGSATFGLIQYPEETHYPIFDNADANRRYVEFLRSALVDGRGRITASGAR